MEPFYMVWNPAARPPTFKHPSYTDAAREAERLATSNPGETFVVLMSVKAVTLKALQWTDLQPIDTDIPF